MKYEKLKKFLKIYAIVVISFVTVVTVIALIITLFQFKGVTKEASEDYYDVGGAKIPSIVKALGEERRINVIKKGTINESPAKVFTYFSIGKIREDLQSYIDYLKEKEKCKMVFDLDRDAPNRLTYLIKYDKNIKKYVEIRVKADFDRYTIGIKLLDEEKVDLEEDWEEGFLGDSFTQN